MRQKGRLKVGADAHISVFGPARVIDKATYETRRNTRKAFGTYWSHAHRARRQTSEGRRSGPSDSRSVNPIRSRVLLNITSEALFGSWPFRAT
jgi:hypothetical protein